MKLRNPTNYTGNSGVWGTLVRGTETFPALEASPDFEALQQNILDTFGFGRV
jgi:hypothetical protein